METIDEERVFAALSEVLDPEIGINIVDLGLIYGVDICSGAVRVSMTMTTPACPMHSFLSRVAEDAVRGRIPEAQSVEVLLVWEPPWSPERMSAAAKHQLGWQS
jgi:metal-sulfur cluster biosynthetic enzyme